MHSGNPDLVELIREKIRRDGPVSFAWFMEEALYHPELGYYSSGRCQIGRTGDYFTNVSVGPFFGRLLATQFAEIWEMLVRPDDFTIVEQGAHHGELARDVFEAARELSPDFFSAVRYSIIEPFPVLQARQRESLREFHEKTNWRKSLAELEPFTGIHFSNELVDAMPVRLIRREGTGDWQERLVDTAGDGFGLVDQPIADEKLWRYLEKLPRGGEGLYETEVNLAALDWMEGVAARLMRGFVLVVDYGHPRDHLYGPERARGTLQTRVHHKVLNSPLAEIGAADITAHVDWTSLAEQAEQHGLAVAGFTDQHHFVTGLLEQCRPGEIHHRALQTLLHPELLGTRFQYLALGKTVPGQTLSGFRFARDPRRLLW
jgi:SAM-dependent MidA family methyltransferase